MDKNSKSSNDNDLNVIFKDEKIKTNKVTEGKATVHLTNDQNTFQAFYNPAQVIILLHRNLTEIYQSLRLIVS
jgi:hypothetical protein